MMTELILVEGVSDVQLISYYLQNVYGWKHEKSNSLGIVQMDVHDHATAHLQLETRFDIEYNISVDIF